MYDELLELWKQKKNNKEKIIAFSYVNKIISGIYNKYNIDFYRFDMGEFAQIYGYKDKNRVNASDIIPLIKNINKTDSSNKTSNLIAVDIPLSMIFNGDNYSIENIINFYEATNADIITLDIDHNILDLISKLSRMKIPVLIYSRNKSDKNQSDYLQDVYNKLIEAESKGALMFILEDYPQSLVQKIISSVLIPVITNEKSNKTDGYYARFSDIFGLTKENIIKYLNLYELINDGVNDCIVDNK